MLKSVISAIPIFSMMCLRIPKKVVNVIGKRMRNCFWNGSQCQDKIPLLAWDEICKSKEVEGVGLKDWNLMNEALREKLVWNVYSQHSQLSICILREKYLDSMDDNRIFTL